MRQKDDLISRQAAIDAIVAWTVEDRPDAEMPTDLVGRINALPSVQPDIVRCKDCKHYAGEGMYCAWDIMVHYDHFYCYHAERRTDD